MHPGELQAGGDLRPSSIYVERPADALVAGLMRRAGLCWVFAPRQIGKSSLARRLVAGLRADGHRAAHVDLSVLGANASAESWFYGLCFEIGRALGQSEAELNSWWRDQDLLSPALRFARWVEGARPTEGPPLVLVLDELDALLAVSFPRAELLGALRNLHAAGGLGLALLGVTTPEELIDDPRATPFNGGQEVRLDDFTRAELDALLPALGGFGADAPALLDAVHGWTSGHPYMSQRLLVELLERREAAPWQAWQTQATVDRLVERLFLRPEGHADAVMTEVDRRMRAATPDARGPALARYAALLEAGALPATGRAEDQLLRLCGLAAERATPQGPSLSPRNRVSRAAFGAPWVEVMGGPPPRTPSTGRPEGIGLDPVDRTDHGESGRRRWAGRAVSFAVPVALAALIVWRIQPPEPRPDPAQAESSALLAAAAPELLVTRGLPAAADAALAAVAQTPEWLSDPALAGAVGRVSAAAARVRQPFAGPVEALAWQGESLWVREEGGRISRILPDQAEATPTDATRAALEARPGCLPPTDDGAGRWCFDASNLLMFETTSSIATMAPLDPAGARPLALPGVEGPGLFARGASALVLDLPSMRLASALGGTRAATAGALSPDGRFAAVAQDDGLVRLWWTQTGAALGVLCGLPSPAVALAFSPDGAALAIGGRDGVRVWRGGTGAGLEPPRGETDGGLNLQLAGPPRRDTAHRPPQIVVTIEPGGTRARFVTGDRAFVGVDHGAPIVATDADAAHHRALTASADGWIRVWDTLTGAELQRALAPGPLSAARLSDGQILATAAENQRLAWPLLPPPPDTAAGYLSTLCAVASAPTSACR